MRGRRKLRVGSIMLGLTVLAASLILAACSNEDAVETAVPADTDTKPPETAAPETAPQTETTAPETVSQTESTVPENAESAPVSADYTITKVQGEADWSSIPVLPIAQILWKPDAGIRAQAQLCYNDDTLFVHLQATEREIRAENTEPLSPVYQDSCLEFFFRPEGHGAYFNFEINPNGCLCLQYGADRSNRSSIVREDAAAYFNIRTNRTDDGWEVFYDIPLEFLRSFIPDYTFSGVMQANFYKCGDKTAQPHYLAWMPVETEQPDYHRPEYFGNMQFEN